MLRLQQALHRHHSPAHLRIHLVHPHLKMSTGKTPVSIGDAKWPSLKLRSRALAIATALAVPPAIVGMLYLTQNF